MTSDSPNIEVSPIFPLTGDLADDYVLKADDLIFSILENASENINDDENVPLSMLEKNAILRVIEKHNGNITRAAKELGLTRTALYRRLSKYDI